MNDGTTYFLYMNSHHAMGVFLFLLFMDLKGGKEMNQKRTEEEIRDYNRRIEEIFRKHGQIPERVYGEGGRWIAIIPGDRKKGDCDEK